MSKNGAAADRAFFEAQRKRLVAMRSELLGGDAARVAGERAPRPDEAKEIEEDAQDMAQSEVDEAVTAVEASRLRAIDRALEKIAEGTYGFSDESGDPIPRARLEAIPEAAFTIAEEEAREKRQAR